MTRVLTRGRARLQVDGQRVLVPIRSYAHYRAVRRFATFEPELRRAVLRWARVSPVVYDIGANIGLYSLLAAVVNPEAAILAFEPEPRTRGALLEGVEMNRLNHIRVLPHCIGDHEGSVRLEVRGASGHRVASGPETAGAVHATITSLDALVARREIPPPSLIKIDVEGFEARVVRGMMTILQVHRPYVVIEVHEKLLARYGDSWEATDQLLRSSGYTATLLTSAKPQSQTRNKQAHLAYVPTTSSRADAHA